jgi:hypothetical protein
MANEYARNIQDASWVITRALTASDGTVTSTDFDLGAGAYKGENYELEVTIPALSAVQLASADTLTLTIQGGAAAAPTTSLNIVQVTTGTGSAIAEQVLRFRLPSNCPQFINAKFVTAGTTGNMSTVSATIKLLF